MFKNKNFTPEMIKDVIVEKVSDVEDKTVDRFIERINTFNNTINNANFPNDNKLLMSQMMPYLASMITAECVTMETMMGVLIELLCDDKSKVDKQE